MRKKKMSFRPVTLILNVIKLLRDAGFKDSINQKEYSISIQDYRPELTAKDYFNEIVEFRKKVEINKGNVKEFYEGCLKIVSRRVVPDLGNPIKKVGCSPFRSTSK